MQYKLEGITFLFLVMVLKTPETDTFNNTPVKNIYKYGELSVLLKVYSNLKHVKMLYTTKTGV